MRNASNRVRALIVGNGGDEHMGVIRTMLTGVGHEIIGLASGMHGGTLAGAVEYAVSGALAPAMYAEQDPDLVIVDLAAAEGGGLATVEALRRIEHPRWVPIMCVGRDNAGPHEVAVALALEAGADFYLARPVNIGLLKACLIKIGAMSVRLRQYSRRRRELQEYFEISESENKVARTIMDGLLRTQSNSSTVLQSWIAPAFKFSGDAMLAERSPDGSLKLLLADGVGHGLSAALNVLPVCRAFQSMAQKGFGLAAMVTELNQTIRRHLPSHRFVATTLVNINAAEKLIEVWNGGNPNCIMMDAMGDVIDTWNSCHLPLGIVDADELDPRPDARVLHDDGHLILFSDGAIEAIDDQGDAFGEAALIEALAEAPPTTRLESLKFALVEHLAGHPANDDVTLALLDCSAEFKLSLARRGAPAEAAAAPGATPWEFSMVVESSRLREIDMAPVLQEFIGRIDADGLRDENVFAALAERYARALDHGLLKLDDGLKAGPEGPQAYARAREEALAALGAGAVRISVAREAGEALPRVYLHESMLGTGATVDFGAEPGAGFDPAGQLAIDEADPWALANAVTIPMRTYKPRDGMDVATIRLHTLDS